MKGLAFGQVGRRLGIGMDNSFLIELPQHRLHDRKVIGLPNGPAYATPSEREEALIMFSRRALLRALSSASAIGLASASCAAQQAIIDVRDFGAGSGDATRPLQTALNAAGRQAPCRVIANDRQYITNELIVPRGVQFEFDLKMRTPPRRGVETNCLRPQPGCRLIGKIEGNDVSHFEVVERGIFPAVDGCHDVYLDVEISKTTVAVQAHKDDLGNPPRRWSGQVIARDIAGFEGGSNGYGLLAAFRDSALRVTSINVPRHALYLVAGASNNRITVDDRGGRFAPIDIAATEGQPECVGNHVTATIREHRGDYPGLPSAGAIIVGGCRGNIVIIDVTDSAPLHSAMRLLASSPRAFPRDNVVHVTFNGQITGNGVVECNSGSGNRVTVIGRGTSTGTPSAVLYVGRNDRITPMSPGRAAAIVERIDFECVSGFQHAVISAMGYAVMDLGTGRVRARGYTGNSVNAYEFANQVVGRP
jgi:hypothetical protein